MSSTERWQEMQNIYDAQKKGYNWIVRTDVACAVCEEKSLTTNVQDSPYWLYEKCMFRFAKTEVLKNEKWEKNVQVLCVITRTEKEKAQKSVENMCVLINERHKHDTESAEHLTAVRKAVREAREVDELERETAREVVRKVTPKEEDPARKNAEELDVEETLIQISQGDRA